MEQKKKICGKYDIKILKEIERLKGKYFNLSAFSRIAGVSKGTIRPAIQRLINNKYIESKSRFSYSLLPEGENILRLKFRTDGSRGVVRNKIKSIHSIEVYLDIDIKNRLNLIELLSPHKYYKSYPKNWVQHNLIFHNGDKLIIKPHRSILYLKEATGRTWEEAEFRVAEKIEQFIEKLASFGVGISEIMVNYSHFASVNDEFAKIVEQKLGKYEKKLKNGKSYWIDYSTGRIESETDDVVLKEKLSDLIDDLIITKSRYSDIDDIAERLNKAEKVILGIVEIESLRLRSKLVDQELQELNKDQKHLLDYVG